MAQSALAVYQRAISLRRNAGMSAQGQDFGALLYGGILRSADKFPKNGAWRRNGRLCPELSRKGLTPHGFAHGSQIKRTD